MDVNGKVMARNEAKEKEQLTSSISLYNAQGRVTATNMRCWIGEATSDALGVFAVDWSAAKFLAPPVNVIATAVAPATTVVYDRVTANLISPWTAKGGTGYTLRGASVGVLIGGTVVTQRIAPGTKVMVQAWGISA
jgi:hypothetical protein